MRALTELSEEARQLALSRFQLLEPHLERGRELRSVADGSGVCFRTLQRLNSRRSGGANTILAKLMPASVQYNHSTSH